MGVISEWFFLNKYTYFDVLVRKYKLLVDEHVLKKRGRRERTVEMVGIVFFIHFSLSEVAD